MIARIKRTFYLDNATSNSLVFFSMPLISCCFLVPCYCHGHFRVDQYIFYSKLRATSGLKFRFSSRSFGGNKMLILCYYRLRHLVISQGLSAVWKSLLPPSLVSHPGYGTVHLVTTSCNYYLLTQLRRIHSQVSPPQKPRTSSHRVLGYRVPKPLVAGTDMESGGQATNIQDLRNR
jgi:hypothetical protein